MRNNVMIRLHQPILDKIFVQFIPKGFIDRPSQFVLAAQLFAKIPVSHELSPCVIGCNDWMMGRPLRPPPGTKQNYFLWADFLLITQSYLTVNANLAITSGS